MEVGFFGELIGLFYNDIYLSIVGIIWSTKWFWLPPILFFTFIKLWFKWKVMAFIMSKEYTLLEIRLPLEIMRGPQAMESVLVAIHNTSNESTWLDRYFKGKCRRWYSLELVSLEGDVRFFIRTRSDVRNDVEAALYSQYPDIEIIEAEEDYSKLFEHVPPHTTAWGGNFAQDKKDSYPIKTYVDYKLDKDGVEAEEMVSPLAPTMEFLSACGEGEQVWLQIMIQATKNKDRRKPGTWFGKEGWKDEAKREVQKLKEKTMVEREESGLGGISNATRAESAIIEAIERSTGKVAYETGIRAIYLGKSENWNGARIAGTINMLKHYSDQNMNGFYPQYVTDFDYPWQDFRSMREDWRIKSMLDAYRKRSWFRPPYQRRAYVLTVEEIATLYHFPGSYVQAPGLKRIGSKRSTAPSNLPL